MVAKCSSKNFHELKKSIFKKPLLIIIRGINASKIKKENKEIIESWVIKKNSK